MTNTIYYLTGRGGQLDKGVGQGLLNRGYKLSGREASGKFDTLSIQNQIDLITQDLQGSFWHKDAKVIAVSYGAYLLLHALSELEPYQGSILLLSPVLGGVCGGESMHYFSPPRSDKLINMIDNESFPKPRKIEIHVGDKDWQSPYERAMKFAEAFGGHCHVLPDTGHQLGEQYVSPVLNEWLEQSHL